MAVTKDVNVSLLNECFELRPFHGLCKPNSQDVLEREEVNEPEAHQALMDESANFGN